MKRHSFVVTLTKQFWALFSQDGMQGMPELVLIWADKVKRLIVSEWKVTLTLMDILVD